MVNSANCSVKELCDRFRLPRSRASYRVDPLCDLERLERIIDRHRVA